MSDFKELADNLSRRLMAEGFTIHRYDAYKTASIYLKLDYGLCNSIRISDHPGYEHLNYRYNIGSWVNYRHSESQSGCVMSYYPIEDVEALIADILRNRSHRRTSYGRRGYEKRKCQLREDVRGIKKGFWAKCKRVRKI